MRTGRRTRDARCPDQHGAVSVRASVGRRIAARQPGEVPRASGYRQAMAGEGPAEEGGGVVACVDDAGAGCAQDAGGQT